MSLRHALSGPAAVVLAFLLAAVAAPGQARAPKQQCTVCHGMEAQELAQGVHADAGLSCTSCHGGNPEALDLVEAHGSELRSLKGPLDGVRHCGGCHGDAQAMRLHGLRTDQASLYFTSPHGQRLQADAGAAVATCVTCHGAHGVLRPTDPRSPIHKLNQVETCGSCHSDPELQQQYGHTADAPAEYRSSRHGEALIDEGHLASPACTDCHGSHAAAPPGVDNVGMVCGHCHTVVRSYFEESPHFEAVEQGLMGECVSCHGDHGVQKASADMLVGGEPGHCGSCHAGQDDGALTVANGLAALLSDLDLEIDRTELQLLEAAKRGLFLEREQGYLDDARDLRVRAAPLTHTLSADDLSDLMSRGQAMIDLTRESLAVKERWFRDHRIFTGAFLAVTLLLVLLLLSYRREVYGR